MANCNYVETLKKATGDYFKTLNELNARKARAVAERKGEYLEEELQMIDDLASAAWATARDNMKAFCEERVGFYQTSKKEQLNGKLPDDINLLSAPVTLTADELQTLADRHQDNYIMQRAVKEYGEKNKILVNTSETPDDKIQAAQELCDHFAKYVDSGITPHRSRNGEHYSNIEPNDERYFNLEAEDESYFSGYDKILG